MIRMTAIAMSLVSLVVADEIEINRPASVTTDRSAEMLAAPDALKDDSGFDVAKTPPKVQFSVVKDLSPFPEDNKGVWSSWGQAIYASDGNFYTSISDHRGVDGRSYIIRYEPATGRQTRVFDSDVLFKHEPGTYGHGKIHGRLERPQTRVAIQELEQMSRPSYLPRLDIVLPRPHLPDFQRLLELFFALPQRLLHSSSLRDVCL